MFSYCPNFEQFRTELEATTTVPHSPRFEFSVHKTFPMKQLNTLTSASFSMKPRSYPSKLRFQAQEDFLPGSFNLSFSTDIGFPISLDFSRDAPPTFSAILPISQNEEKQSLLQLNFRSLLSLNPLILSSTVYQTPKMNAGAAVLIKDNFNFCELNLNFATGKSKGNFVGFSYSINTNNQSTNSLIMQTRFPKFLGNEKLFGLLFNNIGEQDFTFALTTTIHLTNTVHCGTVFQMHPKSLTTEYSFGFQKGFLQSLVCGKITDKGTLYSIIQKKVNDRLTFSMSSFANLFASVYSFGFGLDINYDVAEFEDIDE